MQLHDELQVQDNLITVLVCSSHAFEIFPNTEARFIFRGNVLYTDLTSDSEWEGFHWKLQHDCTPYQKVTIFCIPETLNFLVHADQGMSLSSIVDTARSKNLAVHITLER